MPVPAGSAPPLVWRLPRRRRRPPHGFTLIEMMIVVSIVGVIAAIAVPNLAPVLDRSRMFAKAEEVAALLDRARLLAYNEGRCHRVRMNGSNLELQRLSHADCWTTGSLADANWETALATLQPSLSGLTFDIDVVPTSGAEVVSGSIIFRPNGRLRGDRDLDTTDDGARVVIEYTKVAPLEAEIRVASHGRVCVAKHAGGAPATLSTPVTCP